MAYIPINWEDYPSINTPVNADNLNHMEQGIVEAMETAESGASVAPAWDASVTYKAGQYVAYNKQMWKCLIQNVATIPAEGSTWHAVAFATELRAAIGLIFDSRVEHQSWKNSADYSADVTCFVNDPSVADAKDITYKNGNVEDGLDSLNEEIAKQPMFIKKSFTATSNGAGAFQISEIPYQYTVIDIVVTSANSKTINLKQYDNRGFWVVNSSGSVMGNETVSGVAIGIANIPTE